MASEIDICNLALSHLGDTATIASLDPPEGSVAGDKPRVSRDMGHELPQLVIAARTRSREEPACPPSAP